MCPRYYLGQWIKERSITNESGIENIEERYILDKNFQPRFVLFFETNNINKRVLSLQNTFPNLKYETTIEPGLIDKLLHWMNPYNANETIVIYRNEDFFR